MPAMKRRWTGKADNESKRCDDFTAFVAIVRRRPKLYRMFQDTFFFFEGNSDGINDLRAAGLHFRFRNEQPSMIVPFYDSFAS